MNKLTFVFPDYQDRARRPADNSIGSLANGPVFGCAHAVSADDDQVAIRFPRQANDFDLRSPTPHGCGHLEPATPQPPRERGQSSFCLRKQFPIRDLSSDGPITEIRLAGNWLDYVEESDHGPRLPGKSCCVGEGFFRFIRKIDTDQNVREFDGRAA
jgi:hypothetical protein